MNTSKIDFESLYRHHYDKIYNYILYRVSKKEVAEDLVSDVFTKAIAKQKTFNETKAQCLTWLFAISRNTVIDYYRSLPLNETIALDDKYTKNYCVDDVEIAVREHEQYENLLKEFKNLKSTDRTVIYYRYFCNMSYKDIALKLNCSVSYVGVILSRAIKKLGKKYKLAMQN